MIEAGATHEVFNQASERVGFDAFRTDPLLVEIAGALPPALRDGFSDHGRAVATAEAFDLARIADTHGPVLHRFDAKGRRIDRVEFHPAYHELMRRSATAGLHSSAHDGPAAEAGHRHAARALRFYMTAGLECGHLCPLTMTNASLAALAAEPALFARWRPAILSRAYDPRGLPAWEKHGVTLGMGMTEKQGGTDVRANTTRAEPEGAGAFRLTGHKWFLSAPMSDAFLMLADAGEGPTCFLVPRVLPDGSLNALHLQRLKDKLGNRSNASSEVELRGALAERVGASGRGVRTIIDMVTLTRLDCALASAGLMRAALAEAAHHARERFVFGRALIDQPAMTAVLADMALEVAGATALAMRLAGAFDRAADDPREAAFRRAVTPAAKFWICKRAPTLACEAMECLGGNGYVEDGRLARLYREAPVNAIWEGSGNVMALDLLRVAAREADRVAALVSDIADGLGAEGAAVAAALSADVAAALDDEGRARRLAERMAVAAAAAALAALGREALAVALLRTRFDGPAHGTYGTLPQGLGARALLDELVPAIR